MSENNVDNKNANQSIAESLDKIAKSLWTIKNILLIMFLISMFFLVVAYATVPR